MNKTKEITERQKEIANLCIEVIDVVINGIVVDRQLEMFRLIKNMRKWTEIRNIYGNDEILEEAKLNFFKQLENVKEYDIGVFFGLYLDMLRRNILLSWLSSKGDDLI